MIQALAILLFTLTAAMAAPEQTKLRQTWASRNYTARPFPLKWRVDSAPATVHDLGSFQQWPARTIRIRDVVAKFGVPDRYLVTTRPEKPNFLIYDIPSGHAVAFYVTQPPGDQFSAGVIMDAHGRLLRLMK